MENLLCVATSLETFLSLRDKTTLHLPLNLKAPLMALEYYNL